MRKLSWCLLLSGVGLAGCGDPNFLNPPTLENTVTSIRIWAIHGTPVHLPVAWHSPTASRVRFDQSAEFDFAFDIRPDGTPVLMPQGAFGLLQPAGNPGLRPTQLAWDDIKVAELSGYRVADTLAVAVGDRFYLRTATVAHCFNRLPFYGKLQVMEIDTAERSVLFRLLLNANCGYKGLEPGLPTQ
jgi:hypothetical protein